MTKHALLLCSLTSLFSLAQLSPLQATLEASSPALALNARSADSPLLMREFYPRWSQMEMSQAREILDQQLKVANEKIASITALKPSEMTYANTFGVMEQLDDGISRCYISIYHLSSIADSPAVRETRQLASALYEKYSASVIANSALWQALKTAAQQPWASQLDPERARYVKTTLDAFRDNGADLSPEKKAQLAKVKLELSQLAIAYDKNVLDSTNAWQHVITDPNQLKGMSEHWMKTAAAAALAKGYGSKEKPQWLINLTYPSYGPIMTDCEVEATRRLCWEANCKVGRMAGHENEPIVVRIIALRTELSKLLGFANYADYILARRMAESGTKAMSFVDELRAKVMDQYKQERAHFLDYVSKRTGTKTEKVKPWEGHYYSKELALEENNFDDEQLRPYLPASRMLDGMMELYEELLGIRIKEVETLHITDKTVSATPEQVEVWHPEVKLYEVYDSSSNKMLGAFYLDIYPRSTKREGAWYMPLRTGESGRNGAAAYPHLGALCGNFSPPVDGGEALLSFGEVVVLFHEFGHALHMLLSDSTLAAQSSSSVAWDFVEMPSQLFEFWAWSPEFLKKHALHHKTGAPLPDDLITKLRQSKNYRAGNQNMGQLNLAKLDLELHMNYDKHFKGRSLDAASKELLAESSTPYTIDTPSVLHSFSHIMSGGYPAAYYSYKWAEVLCADAFSRFKKEGLMNKETGASLRRELFAPGSSKPESEIYKNFMGREPNSDALLIEQGLLPTPDSKPAEVKSAEEKP